MQGLITNLQGGLMKKQTKVISGVLILVIAAVFLTWNSFFREQAAIRDQVQEFYDVSYDVYLTMKPRSLNMLDPESIQSQNYLTALSRNTATWKYAYERGYTTVTRSRYPLRLDFKAIEIKGNEARTTVVITGPQTAAQEVYPPFIVLGENQFRLRRVADQWLITEHDYEGPLFEDSKTERIHFSLEELKQQLDAENPWANPNN